MQEIRRPALLAAVGQPCTYCGEAMTAPTRDHIFPRKKGGTLAPHNKALACSSCNTEKGEWTLGKWLHRLRKAGDRRAEIVAAFMASRQPAQ